MNIQIKSTNIKVTSAMNEAITLKLAFLEKFLKADDIVKVKVSKDADLIKVSLSCSYRKKDIRIEESNKDFYVCLDEMCSVTRNKISKLHTKQTDRRVDRQKTKLDESDIDLEDELE